MNSQDYAKQYEQKAAELQHIFEMAKSDEIDQETGQHRYAMDQDQVKDVKVRNEELAEIERKRVAAEMQEIKQGVDDGLKGISRPISRVQHSIERDPQDTRMADAYGKGQWGQPISLHDIVVNSNEFKRKNPAAKNQFSAEFRDIDVKTLLTLTAGWAAVNARTPYVTLKPERTPVIQDYIPTTPTTLQIVKYMEETTATHGAAGVSEGAAKPESTFVYTERSVTIEKIANWLPVTEEQLDDVPGLENLINNRLMQGVRLSLENKILNGPGGGEMTGFYVNSSVLTQSKGADEIQDAIFKAMQKVRTTGYAEPSAVFIHPTDWTTVRLLRTTGGTAGIYIWGPPSQQGPDTLWGKPTVVSTVMTAGQPLTGDFNTHSEIYLRNDMRVDVSDSHSDYFVRNILAIRAEIRAGLAIYRPSAFAYVVA